MELKKRMMPVIRKTHYSSNGLWKKLLKCFLLAALLLVSFSLLKMCISRSSRLDDFSGGRYAETFKTDNSILKKELLSLKPLIVEQELKSTGILERFHRLYAEENTGFILKSAEGLKDFSSENGREGAVFSRYMQWLGDFHKLLGQVTRPLKGAEPYAGEFSDSQEILQKGFNAFCIDSHRPRFALRILNVMFDYAYVMMLSDHPDLSYFESAVSSAKNLHRNCRLSEEERLFLAGLVKRNLSRPFPQQNLIRCRLLCSLRDYEKVRLNGLRLFMGEQKPGTVLKESVAGGSGTFLSALKTMGRDFFYDVDRDQLQTIRMYKAFRSKEFIPYRSFGSRLAVKPSRPMALRELELFRDNMRRQSRSLDDLRELLLSLN